MTFLVILGSLGAAFLLWLLFRFAALALPISAGTACMLAMVDNDAEHSVAIACGFVLGCAILTAGQRGYALSASPLARAFILLLFAVPAGAAGYHGAAPIVLSLAGEGAVSAIFCLVIAVLSTAGACRHVRRMGQSGKRSGSAELPGIHAA